MRLVSTKPEPLKAQVIAMSLNGESKAKIARELHINRNTVARILSEAELSTPFPELMDRHGLTGSILVEKYLKPGLDAMETEFAKFEGKITDEREVVAWGPRHAYLETSLKLRGAYPQEKSPAGGMKISVVVEHIGTQDQAPAEAK
jgi:hypothetical protein